MPRRAPPPCFDPYCPGWLVDPETGVVSRCEPCGIFDSEGEAIAHVEELLERERSAIRLARLGARAHYTGGKPGPKI